MHTIPRSSPRSLDYYLGWVVARTMQAESLPSWTVYLAIFALRDPWRSFPTRMNLWVYELFEVGLASTAVQATAKSSDRTHPPEGNQLFRQKCFFCWHNCVNIRAFTSFVFFHTPIQHSFTSKTVKCRPNALRQLILFTYIRAIKDVWLITGSKRCNIQ